MKKYEPMLQTINLFKKISTIFLLIKSLNLYIWLIETITYIVLTLLETVEILNYTSYVITKRNPCFI